MGSLNGTFLNSQLVQHPDVGSRNWSDPVELADGDVITLGTSSKVFVRQFYLCAVLIFLSLNLQV